VQCLSIFPVLLCVFTIVACLVLYGIESALFAFVIVMPFSHNIATSLCCCNVDHFIPIIAIMRCDCKLALNTIVKKCIWLVLINHELAFEFVHSKPPPSQFLFTSYFSAPCLFAYHSKSSNDVCKMPV
jgi:hypothetical protein